MNEWAVVKFWERVRGPCRLCIPCTTIHCQSCSCIKGLVWWILSLAGCLQSAEVGRDHDPVAPVNDGRCHCRARPGDCLEAGSSLWLSAPLFLLTHPHKAPAQQRVLSASSEKGPAFTDAVASPGPVQPLACLSWVSTPSHMSCLFTALWISPTHSSCSAHCCSCLLYSPTPTQA